MIRPRWRRRAAVTALVAALVGGVVGLAATGTGEPAAALRLLTGDAWLDNTSAGTVSHVSGYTGRADSQIAIGKPGDPFEVVERADGAYVLDLRTGHLSRLDDSTLSVVTTAAEPRAPSALQVVAGPDTTWVVDRSSGIVQQMNPSTLEPVGKQIPLGGRTGVALVDGTGSLWVPLIGPGSVAEVRPDGAVSRQAFGRPGNQVQVADTSTGVWGVDPQAATAASLQDHAAHAVPLPSMASGAAPLVGSSASSPDLVVVEGADVLDVNTSVSSLSSLALPAAARARQVTISQGRAYLLDTTINQLETVDLTPLHVLPPVTVPAGSTQLVSKDNLVFVNSPDSPQALVVNAEGAVTDIAKYVLANPAGPVRHGRGHLADASGTTGATAPANTPGPSPAGPINTASSLPGPTPTAPPTTAAPTTPPPATLAPSPTTALPPGPTTTVPPTSPGPATNLAVHAGDGVITVAWSPPASDGGSPVLRYQVTALPSGTSPSVNAPTTTVVLTGQPDGTQECVRVQAFNRAAGGGPISPPTCVTPQKNSPGRVGNVRATAAAPGQISLSWSQPSLGPYNTPIKSYTVSGGPTPMTLAGTSQVITGLANGRTYTFTVVATNAAGNAGPASAAVGATTWSHPGPVQNLTVTSGAQQLTIKWGKASIPKGSPPLNKYVVSVGGSTVSTNSSTLTKTVSAPAWTNEKVKVYAVNSVGNGPTSLASGTAWARSSTALCHDVLSGDVAVLNQGLCPSGGAWVDEGNSSISWISAQAGHSGPGIVNEYLCVTYYTGSVSGDLYAVVDRPTQAACTAALPNFQPPDTPHVIAYVSTRSPGGSSQHVCDYEGHTTGTSGSYTSYELSPCGHIPSGLTGTSQKFSFYT